MKYDFPTTIDRAFWFMFGGIIGALVCLTLQIIF